jgi:DNA-binding NtrC family response regulator
VLLAYPWPGNVRELSHVIERAVLWSRDTTIKVEHLSLATPVRAEPDGREQVFDPANGAKAVEPAPQPSELPPHVDLSQCERTLIERAMRVSGGIQTKAAQRLGITRDTLRYRLKKFGIQSG